MSSGANVEAVQRMLSHAPAAMTFDVYSAPAERMDAAHDEAVPERLPGAGRDARPR